MPAVWPESKLKYEQTKHLEDRYRAWFVFYFMLLILKNYYKAFHSPVDQYLSIYTYTHTHTENRVSDLVLMI